MLRHITEPRAWTNSVERPEQRKVETGFRVRGHYLEATVVSYEK
jgi:hypothetical protein